jgi:hypothetical protein
LVGVAIVFLTKCIDADEGIGAIDGRLLLLIVAMLTLGSALHQSGALTLIVEGVSPLLATTRPIVALVLVYALTSILTELVTNNAGRHPHGVNGDCLVGRLFPPHAAVEQPAARSVSKIQARRWMSEARPKNVGSEAMLRKLVMLVLLGYFVSKVMEKRERRAGMTGARPTNRQAELRRRGKPAGDWDMVDERSNESFPASDPPGTY